MTEPRRTSRETSGEWGARPIPWSLLLTAGFVALAALAVGTTDYYLASVVVAAIASLVATFRIAFHSSRAFCLTLANLAGIYACIFLFFAATDFPSASPFALSAGFVLPLIAFVAGSFRHRAAITGVAIAAELREQRHLGHILLWLGPVFAIGIATSLLPSATASANEDAILLAAMIAISFIILFVSRNVAVFLLDIGLLFEEFFARIAGLIVPAFAFLTCYSLLVILFASVYSIMDHVTAGRNFRIEGAIRAISFPESLYFSLTTLSTVGYGDIAPASNAVRLIAGGEIVCGILLLLFGFNEIFSFAHRRGSDDQV